MAVWKKNLFKDIHKSFDPLAANIASWVSTLLQDLIMTYGKREEPFHKFTVYHLNKHLHQSKMQFYNEPILTYLEAAAWQNRRFQHPDHTKYILTWQHGKSDKDDIHIIYSVTQENTKDTAMYVHRSQDCSQYNSLTTAEQCCTEYQSLASKDCTLFQTRWPTSSQERHYTTRSCCCLLEKTVYQSKPELEYKNYFLELQSFIH